ncbi:hypothetical protein [Micrococcus endophyticus]|uniref:hypothetical protein n=1 Tax=Micrococcus endophyticus TaxID=455343 RepID=UPI002006C675|nr:hypothetical protein [Micrococcus endophyticus]MCK6091712.1 hypothetical protein [Micrococcus endophyticus]
MWEHHRSYVTYTRISPAEAIRVSSQAVGVLPDPLAKQVCREADGTELTVGTLDRRRAIDRLDGPKARGCGEPALIRHHEVLRRPECRACLGKQRQGDLRACGSLDLDRHPRHEFTIFVGSPREDVDAKAGCVRQLDLRLDEGIASIAQTCGDVDDAGWLAIHGLVLSFGLGSRVT